MINLPGKSSAQLGDICFFPSLNTTVENPRLKNGVGVQVVFQPDLPPADRAQQNAFKRIEPSLHYMMQHLTEPLNVALLSDLAGLSNSTFFAYFKTATGRTPIDFLIRTRMDIAARLLEETRLQIKAVAGLLGYEDQFYFSRLFKSAHGLAPQAYRVGTARVSNWNLKSKCSKTDVGGHLVGSEKCQRNSAQCWQISFAHSTERPKAAPKIWQRAA